MMNYDFTVNTDLSPQDLEIQALVKHLLVVLSDKERFIIENRFALEENSKLTLEEIGKHFGVTRERIRQIERAALRKLERSAINTNVSILTEFAKALLKKQGGVVQDAYFKELLLKILPNISEDEIQSLHLALVLDRDIRFSSNTLKHHPYWSLSRFPESFVKNISKLGVDVLKSKKQVMDLSDMATELSARRGETISTEVLEHVLRITKACKFTDHGVGLYTWRHIHPRNLRDKINYIFNQHKKPLHFKKIAKLIEEAQFDDKSINVQATHNELIRNEDFVLIGRGIYALKSWGYSKGTVADVIEDILEDGKARTREEITKAVLDQRMVKTITIYLNLKNKDQFVRVGRDKYSLAKFAKEA